MDIRCFLFDSSQKLKALTLPFLRDSQKAPFKPGFVSLEVENTCCLACQHCDIWKNKKSARMTQEQMQQTIKKLYQWLGFFRLNLTGGEPFLNRETMPLIRYASKLGISTHVNTNGYLFNEKLAQEVVKSGLKSLSFSLDSLHPQVHDQTRGKSGAFVRVNKAIDWVNSLRDPKKLYLSLTVIMMEPNLGELKNLVAWAKKKKIEAVHFQPLWQNFGADFDPQWFKTSSLWPQDKGKVSRAIEELKKLKESGFPISSGKEDLERFRDYFFSPLAFGKKYPCFVGLTNFAVDIHGDVRLCFNFPPVGNILKEKPAAIWNGPKAQKQREMIKKCRRGCRVLLCNHLPRIKLI